MIFYWLQCSLHFALTQTWVGFLIVAGEPSRFGVRLPDPLPVVVVCTTLTGICTPFPLECGDAYFTLSPDTVTRLSFETETPALEGGMGFDTWIGVGLVDNTGLLGGIGGGTPLPALITFLGDAGPEATFALPVWTVILPPAATIVDPGLREMGFWLA